MVNYFKVNELSWKVTMMETGHLFHNVTIIDLFQYDNLNATFLAFLTNKFREFDTTSGQGDEVLHLPGWRTPLLSAGHQGGWSPDLSIPIMWQTFCSNNRLPYIWETCTNVGTLFLIISIRHWCYFNCSVNRCTAVLQTSSWDDDWC